MRYTNPKLCGYIYRRKVKCGKSTCRCTKSKKFRHTAYYVQYRERVNGTWKRRSEYVPKMKVKALRQRIKRAKARDKAMQKNTRDFLFKMPRLVNRIKRNPFDIRALDDAEKLMNSLKQNPKSHLTKLQIWTIFAQVVDLIAAVVYPENSLMVICGEKPACRE